MQPRDDVMLHLSVRPQENCIIRNHFKNQTWGAEERFGGNPIQAHQSFEISIVTEHSQFRISVNGQHFCTFAHRLPVNLVQFVSISGTCTIAHITIDHSGPSIGFPSMPVNPSHPIHPRHPPIHHHPPSHHHPPTHHHPPAPPPMPHYPPPYPGLYSNILTAITNNFYTNILGHYPGNQHPTPYTVFKHELMDKMNHLKHHDQPHNY